MPYRHTVGPRNWQFADLRELLAKASPERAGDRLAGVAAGSAVERMAARMCLAEVPLARFLEEPVIPYEQDEVTRLIIDGHDAAAFREIGHLSVGEFRDWLLSDAADEAALARLRPAITPVRDLVGCDERRGRDRDRERGRKRTLGRMVAAPFFCRAIGSRRLGRYSLQSRHENWRGQALRSLAF
jgi:ethanolamine ammonia-lyase large subunit